MTKMHDIKQMHLKFIPLKSEQDIAIKTLEWQSLNSY